MCAEEVSGKITANAKLILTSRKAKQQIEIVFTDNVPGVPNEILKRIFEPLYNTKNFDVSLGLPIVKQIMEQHGDRIDIRTKVGDGNTMTLRLPGLLAQQPIDN